MPYRDIDPIIAAWAASHELVLFSDARRFCHTSSASGECFQLVVEPPASGSVTISAWSIETRNDEELHRTWTVPIVRLPAALEEALAVVEGWKRGIGRPA